MFKRLFLPFIALLAALGLVAGSARDAGAGSGRRPNVVILFADDLGRGDLGCYGHPKFKTPNIDRLAAEGMRLTQFYVPVPYCAPSRASLLTGRYPNRCGLVGNPFPSGDPQVKNADHLGLPTTEVTLADLFRKAGYRTGAFGKWHLGHQPQFRPRKRGFDEYMGVLYSNDMHPVELWDNDRMAEYPVVQTTMTRRLTERALKFIDRNRKRPFFLYFPQPMPHKPLAPSQQFYGKTGTGLYGDTLAELDWSVGQVLDRLKATGLERNTLVVFASDNGPWYGGSTGGLRGMKGQAWEGGIRVPMIARFPGRIPAGRVSDAPGIIMDLFPTALAAAGIEPPAGVMLDGKNLLPVLEKGEKSPHEALFCLRGPQVCGVRSGKWKLYVTPPGPAKERVWKPEETWIDPRGPDGVRILAPFEQPHPSQFPGVMTGDPGTPPSLFDLETDPAEQRNVAAQHPEVVRRLTALCDRFRADVRESRAKAPRGRRNLSQRFTPRRSAQSRKVERVLVRR